MNNFGILMKKAVYVVLALLTMAAVWVCGRSSSYALDLSNLNIDDLRWENVQYDVNFHQDKARELLDMVNAYRATVGAQALVWDYGLEKYAMQRAAEMTLRPGMGRPNFETYYGELGRMGLKVDDCGGELNHYESGSFSNIINVNNAYQFMTSDQKGRESDKTYVAMAAACAETGGIQTWSLYFSRNTSKDAPTQAVVTTQKVTVSVCNILVNSCGFSTDNISVMAGENAKINGDALVVIEDKAALASEYLSLKDIMLYDSTHLKDYPIDWKSSDTSIVTVANGSVTGVKEGTATLTGVVLEKPVSITVTVKAKPEQKTEDDKQGNDDSDSDTEEIPYKTGDVFSNALYGINLKVLDANKGTVSVTGAYDKSATSVVLPKTVTSNGQEFKVVKIEKNAFKNNKKLKSITIGSNITEIGQNAFYKCTALAKVVLPSGVNKIGASAFYGCKNLKSVTIKSTQLTDKNVGKNAFKSINSKASLKVPSKKLKAYKALLKKKGVTGKSQKIKK